MKKYLALLIFCFVSLILISSCKKDDEPKQPSKTDILTAKAWQFQDARAFDQSLTTLGLTDALGGLTNSDFKFNADGTYVATNRSTGTASQGKWEFASNETVLLLDKGTAEETSLQITTLTDKNLDLKLSFDKNSVDASRLPDNIRALLLFAPATILVDILLVAK